MGNTCDILPKEICQILYSLYQAKEITKKECNNVVNLIKLQYKMDTIFIYLKNSKTSEPYKLLLNYSCEINLKKGVIKIKSKHILYMEKYEKVIQKQ